jgi:hypothetical protein
MKTCGEAEAELQHSSPRNQMEVSARVHTSAALPSGKKHPKWVGWSGRCEIQENLLPLAGIEHRPSSPYPVSIQTELSQLP